MYNNTIWILLFPMHLPDNPTICTSDFFHVVYKCDQSLLKKKFSYAERTSNVKLVSHPGQASLLARSRWDLGWEIIAETKQRIHSYILFDLQLLLHNTNDYFWPRNTNVWLKRLNVSPRTVNLFDCVCQTLAMGLFLEKATRSAHARNRLQRRARASEKNCWKTD